MAVPSSPTSSMPASSNRLLFDHPTASKAAINSSCWAANSRRRLTRSPSGTTNNKASAQPSWVTVITMPTAARLMPKSAAMASSSGCA